MPLFACYVDACLYECGLHMPECATYRSLSMSISVPARQQQQHGGLRLPPSVQGIIIISSWVSGVLEANSWGTHIKLGTTMVQSVMLLAAGCSFLWCCCCGSVAILLLLLIELLRTTAMLLLVDVYRWQRWHHGKFCRSRGCPVWFGGSCCGPRLLPRQLLCCVA